MYYRILVASQRFHGKESLTYSSDETLRSGQIVAVPLQNKVVLGIVETETSKPSFAAKPIASSWDTNIPTPSLALLKWLQIYYPAPLGLITELFTPPQLPKKLPEIVPSKQSRSIADKLPPLTTGQEKIMANLSESDSSSFLLHGDTGSGKTRIYLELAKQTLMEHRSVIVLTPEIGLTGPLLDTFTKTFGEQVLVTHSEMTPAQRRSVWLSASHSNQPIIIIGPRSALFSPLKNIGLIVMDEAHDSAYKQEQAPYYQTSRVAARLAQLHEARFIMGTATPLITDYFTFKEKGLPILRMAESAIKGEAAGLTMIDLRDKAQFSKSAWLANSLIDATTDALQKGEQALFFLNRRGSARLVLCDNCGWQALCPHCDVPLTYHHDNYEMRCHSCDFSAHVPTSCPTCGAHELLFQSIGTKALESELTRLFPKARIGRFDRDTLKPERLSQQHEALQTGTVDIVIGTQSIAKGFDLPKLSVVGIVQADSGLQIPDYTATERTYQLISQVSGRIGRGHRASKLFVQSFEPGSELIHMATAKQYSQFYEQELEQRKRYTFPPFSYLLKIRCDRASSQSALKACQKLAHEIRVSHHGIIVEGPSPRFIEKVAGRYVWHIIVKSKKRSNLLEVIKALPAGTLFDLDPSDLL